MGPEQETFLKTWITDLRREQKTPTREQVIQKTTELRDEWRIDNGMQQYGPLKPISASTFRKIKNELNLGTTETPQSKSLSRVNAEANIRNFAALGAVLQCVYQLPILPVAIKGTFKLWPPSRAFPKIKKIVEIKIGMPINLKGKLTSTNIEGGTKRVMKEISKLLR